MCKYTSRFSVGDLVKNEDENVLMVTDILKDGDRNVYECNDGQLYYEDDLVWEV
jgi:hypothetical protein